MNDEILLRDALWRATANQPWSRDRVGGAFAKAAQRRRRKVAASCATAAGVFVVMVLAVSPGDVVSLDDRTPPAGRVRTMAPPPSPPRGPVRLAAPGPPGTASPEPAARPGGSASSLPRLGGPLSPPRGTTAPTGGRLDVYVLLDTTMSTTMVDLPLDRALLAMDARLAAAGVDVAWGLGEFKDGPDVPDPRVYRRLRAVGPGVVRIRDIAHSGGTGDPGEAGTLGLEGSVGVAYAPYSAAGDAAGWRPGARRVVLLVSDAPFDESPPNPTADHAARTLTEHGVSVVGLLWTGEDADLARDDMRAMAAATGGVATAPVDCDGDGGADLRRGDPLVCDLTDRNDVAAVGDAIAGLLR